ncbi:MAG: T9SS type A sorting domain-containing protein [Calditrichaceae bacterium]
MGVKDGGLYQSDIKFINYYQIINTLNEDFDSGPILVAGDFEISQESGFTSAALHTNHNYDDQRDYISVIETPIRIFNDSRLSYDNVAIVEPGEPGKYYPDPQMWDYVTVEGSDNGADWKILITPYDCRSNGTWQTAYDGFVAGNSSMFVNQEINLSDFYSAGTKIYLRFRLHADEAANGWGWAIDNVNIVSDESTFLNENPDLATEFKLIGNYPNPFNPGTTIRFTLKQTGPVQLEIFNNLGQKVNTIINNKEYSDGKMHQVYWDGRTSSGSMASSGTYYYRLVSGNQSQVKKMILLR